jgi:hypothetical protein
MTSFNGATLGRTWKHTARSGSRTSVSFRWGGANCRTGAPKAHDEMAEELMEPKLESIQPVLMSRNITASVQLISFRALNEAEPIAAKAKKAIRA